MFNRILLAIDDSASGPAAVSFAIAMANASDASVRVVHINELLVGGRGHTVETRNEAAEVLDDALSELRGAGVPATGLVATANCFNVGRSIAAAADEWTADVIVVGSLSAVPIGPLARQIDAGADSGRHLLAGHDGPRAAPGRIPHPCRPE